MGTPRSELIFFRKITFFQAGTDRRRRPQVDHIRHRRLEGQDLPGTRGRTTRGLGCRIYGLFSWVRLRDSVYRPCALGVAAREQPETPPSGRSAGKLAEPRTQETTSKGVGQFTSVGSG